ncbi:MAG: hypothetical protein OEV44_04590 [Spirochaetota bacterium]|nr:hypothetical protein [Spirochaetota bacterium]
MIHTAFSPKHLKLFLQKLSLKLPFILSDRPIIWIHGVSAGEISSIKVLVDLLKDKYSLFITTSTITGMMMAKKLYQREVLSFFPYDYPILCRRLIKRIKPKAIFLVELEIWPMFLKEAYRLNIPTFLISGRIGDKEFNGYNFFKSFFKEVFNLLTVLLMQSKGDYEKMKLLGVDESKIYTSGNIKFDLPISDLEPQLNDNYSRIKNQPLDEVILIAASTHNGEESLFLKVYAKLKLKYPYLKMIIAPRHPERTNQIRKIIKSIGFTSLKWSKININNCICGKWNEEVLLVDSIGELMFFYQLADITLIGGSFVNNIGGHNPIEPAFYSKPIIIGPSTNNFRWIVQSFLNNSALIQIKCHKSKYVDELYTTIEQLILNKSLRKDFGERAKELINMHNNVSQRVIKQIESYIN